MGLARDREQDLGGLAGLSGLATVAGQLGERIAVLRAEQARRQVGLAITRPAWKNLVFTGGPGAGKSRAARAVARVYAERGLLSSGHVDEVAAASVVGATPRETGVLVGETVKRAGGGIMMIPDMHAWYRPPDRGQQVLRRLYQELTEWRDDLAVILAGQAGPRNWRSLASCAAPQRSALLSKHPEQQLLVALGVRRSGEHDSGTSRSSWSASAMSTRVSATV